MNKIGTTGKVKQSFKTHQNVTLSLASTPCKFTQRGVRRAPRPEAVRVARRTPHFANFVVILPPAMPNSRLA